MWWLINSWLVNYGWFIFFGSLLLSATVVYAFMPKKLRGAGPFDKESQERDKRIVGAVVLTVAAWIVGAIIYHAYMTQSYWYCWDSGNLSPHHLGYSVSGDHLCSKQELHDAGWL
jgi:hypothetical protein